MNTMDISDDFERFCQIAQRSPRDMLSPSHNLNQSAMGRMSMQVDYLATPDPEQLKRTSSFREPRRRASFQPSSFSGDISASRSPVRLNYPLNYPSDNGPYLQTNNLSSSQSITRQKPRFSEDINITTGKNVDFDQYRDDDLCEDEPVNSLTVNRPGQLRKRPGSMKETRRNRHLVDRYGFRPSVPVVHTGSYMGSSHSPNKFKSTPSEENMVRVRRFERNKHGQVISKGDKDIPQIEIFPSRSPSTGSRGSFADNCLSGDGMLDDVQHSESSLSETDVIEIPAITTTLASPSRSPIQTSPRYLNKRASSPTRSLKPEARIRSKSLAMVWDRNRTSPQSYSPPGSENPIANRLFQVQVLGTSRVGKTGMCMQFHTSESIEDPSDSIFDDIQDRPVTVEVNNVKASLVFIEADLNPDDLQDDFNYSLIIDTADAFLVVYAIDDRASFYAARKIIGYLLSQCKRSSAIILAANKSDLVRTRVVTEEEGKNLAQVYSCSFFEVSTSLNHRVDDLLVGILIGIQNQQINVQKERNRLDRIASQRRGSHGSPKHKSSITALKSPAHSVVKFFRKHFVPKKNQQSLM